MKVTEGQQKGLAKYLYDISKLVFAGAVVGPVFTGGAISSKAVVYGLGVSLLLAVVAFFLDR